MACSVSKYDDEWHKSLRRAINNKDLDRVKYLMNLHGLPNVAERKRMNAGFTNPVYVALESRSKPIIQYFLDLGFNPNKTLGDAIQTCSVRIVMMYLLAGADPKGALHHLSLCFGPTAKVKRIVDILIKAGADANNREKRKFLPPSMSGTTPLMVISNLDVVKTLIEHGADVNEVDNNGKTVLMWAAGSESPSLFLYLLRQSTNIHAKDHEGETALTHAVNNGDVKITLILLGAGADVNSQNKDGRTALHHAVMNGSRKLVKILMGAGADPKIKDRKGREPAYYAEVKVKTSIGDLLND